MLDPRLETERWLAHLEGVLLCVRPEPNETTRILYKALVEMVQRLRAESVGAPQARAIQRLGRALIEEIWVSQGPTAIFWVNQILSGVEEYLAGAEFPCHLGPLCEEQARTLSDQGGELPEVLFRLSRLLSEEGGSGVGEWRECLETLQNEAARWESALLARSQENLEHALARLPLYATAEERAALLGPVWSGLRQQAEGWCDNAEMLEQFRAIEVALEELIENGDPTQVDQARDNLSRHLQEPDLEDCRQAHCPLCGQAAEGGRCGFCGAEILASPHSPTGSTSRRLDRLQEVVHQFECGYLSLDSYREILDKELLEIAGLVSRLDREEVETREVVEEILAGYELLSQASGPSDPRLQAGRVRVEEAVDHLQLLT